MPHLEIQEVTINLVNNLQAPAAVINLDSLVGMGVVPQDWELAQAPVYTPQVVQLRFQNGIVIAAQPGRILLTEILGSKAIAECQVADLARKLVQCLPNLEYEAIGLNPLGHAKLGDTTDVVQQYLNQTLLAPGPWQQIGNEPVRSRISFTYTFDENQLNLTINEAGLRNDQEEVTPVVLFSGNFSSAFSGNTTECIAQLLQSLERWQQDLERFQSIVNETFLSTVSAQPTLLPAFA